MMVENRKYTEKYNISDTSIQFDQIEYIFLID